MASSSFPIPESNPRPYGGLNRGFDGYVVFSGRIGEPLNRQGAALFNQGFDLLNHGIASKTVSWVRLELARRDQRLLQTAPSAAPELR